MLGQYFAFSFLTHAGYYITLGQICFLCYKIYAFQRMNTSKNSKMTQTEGLLLLAQPVQS